MIGSRRTKLYGSAFGWQDADARRGSPQFRKKLRYRMPVISSGRLVLTKKQAAALAKKTASERRRLRPTGARGRGEPGANPAGTFVDAAHFDGEAFHLFV